MKREQRLDKAVALSASILPRPESRRLQSMYVRVHEIRVSVDRVTYIHMHQILSKGLSLILLQLLTNSDERLRTLDAQMQGGGFPMWLYKRFIHCLAQHYWVINHSTKMIDTREPHEFS